MEWIASKTINQELQLKKAKKRKFQQLLPMYEIQNRTFGRAQYENYLCIVTLAKSWVYLNH